VSLKESEMAAAFEATLAQLGLTAEGSISFDATVVPDRVESWTSFRGSGPLPSMPVRFSDAALGPRTESVDAELELLDLLGEGGMGQVYRATQRSLGREVAVKTVRQATSARAVAALCDEAVVTGRLSHPNVIPVHALGEAGDGRPLLVMKRVEGVGWNVLLRSADHAFWTRTKLAPDDRLHFHIEVLRKVTHAVEFAHRHGIVHRDIKPENVMIGDYGEVYLVDWGIAVRAGTNTEGKLAGTPSYLAPEMVGGAIDARTDVYLLGATLLEILTGAPPHRGVSLEQVLRSAFLSEPPTFPDDVPSELAELCTRALARDPADRPATAHAFGEALDDHVRHRGSRALARTGEERVAQLRRTIEEVSTEQRDLVEVRRLVAESRFAFHEARRAWADNPAVAPGLRASLRLAVRAELDRRDAQAARAMLRELEVPDPELTSAVDALDAELTREAHERARLEQLAHDLDPGVEMGVRVASAAVVIAMTIALGIYVVTADLITSTHLFGFALVILLGLAALLAVFWRRIMRTMFNRRIAAWAAIGSLTMVAHRGVALFDPAATVEGILTTDFVLLGGFWAFGSLFVTRWMLGIGIGVGLCAIPAIAFPSAIAVLFSAANALSCATFIVGWRLTHARSR